MATKEYAPGAIAAMTQAALVRRAERKANERATAELIAKIEKKAAKKAAKSVRATAKEKPMKKNRKPLDPVKVLAAARRALRSMEKMKKPAAALEDPEFEKIAHLTQLDSLIAKRRADDADEEEDEDEDEDEDADESNEDEDEADMGAKRKAKAAKKSKADEKAKIARMTGFKSVAAMKSALRSAKKGVIR